MTEPNQGAPWGKISRRQFLKAAGLAAAIGAKIPIAAPSRNMIVDMGGGVALENIALYKRSIIKIRLKRRFCERG